MSCTTEERINRMQSENSLMQDTKKAMVKSEGGLKLNNDEAKSSITELFPWMSEFRKMCRCIHEDKSMTSLTELMQFYARNVSISVNECYTRPLRAARLKDCISETLLLFLYIYRELSKDRDRSVYLNNMSDLLAMYVDMELKASKKSKEEYDKICARLTSCLYVYLEHSTEYLLDTLMKIQFMCHSYHHILDPIITKIIKNIPIHPESNIMYVRYLLIYRLWRKINGDAAVRNQIITAAIASLGPPPSVFPPCILEDVLPKVPKCHPNATKALLQHKFDIKKCCELFVQFCRENNGSMCQEKDGGANHIDSSTRINSKMPEDVTSKSVENIDNNVNSILIVKNKQNGSISSLNTFKSLNMEEETSLKCLSTFSDNISKKCSTPKSIKSNKNLSQRKSKKSNEIVIIDLTNDIALEKCIKKRKSRKLPWLEEAKKKKVDLKTVKASRKMKNMKQEKSSHMHVCDNTKIINNQSGDESQCLQAIEITNLRSSLNTCRPADILNSEQIDCVKDTRQMTDLKFKNMETTVKASDDTTSSSSFAIQPLSPNHLSTKQFSNVVMDDSISDNINVLDMKDDKDACDKLKKQTVIKRLIETNIFSETERHERVDSLKKICDLETECPNLVYSVTVCTQYNPKDDTHNSNLSNFNVTEDKLTQSLTSPRLLTQSKQNNQNESTDDNINMHEKSYTPNQVLEVTDSKSKCTEIVATSELRAVEAFAAKNIIKYEEKNRPHTSVESPLLKNEIELQDETKLLARDCTRDKLSSDTVEKNDSQTHVNLDIANYIEASGDTTENKLNHVNIRNSIFDTYSMDRKNSYSISKVGCPTENGNNYEETLGIDKNDKKCDVKDNHQKDFVKEDRKNEGKSTTKQSHVQQNPSPECNELSSLIPEKTTTKKVCEKLCNATEGKDTQNNSLGNKYIVQDTELQDGIDGLSLLASVSQHVPHLKSEHDVKCDQIKVKDYASLKYACHNQTTDDETDTNDSSNTVCQLLENPSNDIINRIVGIYPEDALDKVALHVEVTSSDTIVDNVDNGLCNIIPHSETNINYDTDVLSHNMISIENNIQPAKENTNVILNGETVVLLQKSPNSNLYIINKAVENSKDHSNDDDITRLKEKNWLSVPEECGQFEVVTSPDHGPFNLELSQYKEIPYQENKYTVRRNKGIKMEPEESSLLNLAETKSYSKKLPLTTDNLPVPSQMYQEVSSMNVGISKAPDKRKTSKSNITFRQSIKQEFSNVSSHISSNCAIQGCSGIHSHPQEIDTQHPLHIPVTRPATLPSIYGNCAGGTDLCVPYHKHCTSVSCSLQINATTSLHTHTKPGSSCGRSHCSCLNCTYDIVTHCRQCIHPATDSRVSCIESNPYFLPTHSSVQTPAVQEHDRTKAETMIGKLYDDELLCKIENGRLQNNTLEKLELQHESEKLLKKDMDNKLPLKKRLKAHAMISATYEVPIKAEKVDNYPGVPMMSIAALEALDNTQKRSSHLVKSEYELPSPKKDESHDNYHFNSNLVRRDYYKDMHISNSHHNITKEGTRKHECEFRSANGQSKNTICQESCLQRTLKSSVQCKEINLPSIGGVKRFGAEAIEQGGPYKKTKKTQSPLRQTRSSKRNVPKVNYCYTDVDPEWNPSGESKRKRKKTSR